MPILTKYFYYRGEKIKHYVWSDDPSHMYVVMCGDASEYDTFKTREEARKFCNYHNEGKKRQCEMCRVFKLKEEGNG